MPKRDPLSWVLVIGPIDDGSVRIVRLDGRVEIVPEHLKTDSEIAAHFGVGWVRHWKGPGRLTNDYVDAVARSYAERVRPEATDLETALAGASRRFDDLLSIWVDGPLSAAGLRRKGRRWSVGDADVQPIVEVSERNIMRMTEGMILFTLELGIWVRSYALHVLSRKRPTPGLSTAPYFMRLGWFLTPSRDRWWIVSDRAVYESAYPPIELPVATVNDEVPTVFRQKLAPEMLQVSDIGSAIDQMVAWEQATPLQTRWAESESAERLRELAV